MFLSTFAPILADDGGGLTLLSARRVVVTGGTPNNQSIATSETPLANGAGGLLFYQEGVRVPARHNVMLVTLSATGSSTEGGQIDLACIFDADTLCEAGPPEVMPQTPSGWVSVQRYFFPNSAFPGDPGTFAGEATGTVIISTRPDAGTSTQNHK
jgi:hypothetical protein